MMTDAQFSKLMKTIPAQKGKTMKYRYFWNDGRTADLEPFSRAYDRAMPNDHRSMRIGSFTVVVSGDGKTFISARAYQEHILDEPRANIARSSKFWSGHRRDRLNSLDMVERALPAKHPHRDDLLKDIAREREHFA